MTADEPLVATAFQPLSSTTEQAPKRWNPLRFGLAAVLLLFALTMGFLFSAKSVLIEVVPADTDVDVEGWLQLQLGARLLLLSGDHQLQLAAEGYHPQASTLEINEADNQNYYFELRKLPGRVDILSQPAGASVIVEQQLLGTTPLQGLELAAGPLTVEVRAPRYLSQTLQVEITGRAQHQSLNVTLAPAWGDIRIDSIPSGAAVLLDGEEIATTPMAAEILQGEHQLQLLLPKYQSRRVALTVIAGEAQNLGTVTLVPADAILNISSGPSHANVTVDGEYYGQTPLAVPLGPGQQHRIAVFKPGYNTVNRQLTLDSGVERDLHITLPPQLGEVEFRVQPADAEVWVNGQRLGVGNQIAQLPAFAQQLEVRREGYASHRQHFTPRTSLQQIITVTLQTAREAKLAGIKPLIRTTLEQQLLLFTPGDFTMGASRREPGRRANEVLHPVSLTRLFYLQTTEVSNAQYRKFKPQHSSGQIEGKSLNNDRQPVVDVSWQDAARFCNWLSEREQLKPFYQFEGGTVSGFFAKATGYRLPTEAEWAWAARVKGARMLRYGWGDDYPPTQVSGNFSDRSAGYITGRVISGYNDKYAVSAPTGSFEPNHNRLFDMAGNVAEWVHDVYTIPPSGGAVSRNPLGKTEGANHVIRGASWAKGTVSDLRLSFRDYGKEGRDDVGFRIARFAE